MTYFHQCENFPDIQIHLTPSFTEQDTSENTEFSRELSITGISSIQVIVILAITAYFANPYWKLSDLSKGKLSTLVALLELSY